MALRREERKVLSKVSSRVLSRACNRGYSRASSKASSKGQAEEARRLLRAVLADRFPGTETMLEIDHIAEASALESLLVDRF